MESLGNPPFLLMDGDDIFNFPLDGEDGIDPGRRFSELEFAEEELEWLSNKDAFPAVETGLDIFTPHQNLQSPISVLENSSSSSNSNGSGTMSCCGALPVPISFPVHYPVRARSKRRRRRRREFPELPVAVQQAGWWNQVNVRNVKQDFPKALPITGGSSIGRRCQHCQAEKTPQWRAGPMGPKTLCNACGVRYKSGRLVPEYRPANSPTFSSQVHSNSHRKIMEMRRHTLGDNMMVK